MPAEPYLVLFCGGLGGSTIEDAVAEALRACALDTLDEALSTGAYGGAIVVADADAAEHIGGLLPAGVHLEVDPPDEAFRLGRRFSEIVTRYGLERPVYSGCGLPLIKGDEWAAVASALASSDLAVVSNNYFSADLVGFVPGEVVQRLDLPDNDRIWPRFLVSQGGLVNQALPRTITNQFDIDTPNELSILAYAGGAGPRLTDWLKPHPLTPSPLAERGDQKEKEWGGLSFDTERIAKAAWCFTDRNAVVLVAGRISTEVLQYLQSETASQTRLYSEERGMQALGRDISGEARSLLAFHLQAVGARRFFEELAQMGTAAFIDTRPLFAHIGLQPSRHDRFLSDALQPEGIDDPWVREFTAAALEASIPVVLGGQSLVTSGLQLLSEAAWREHDKLDTEYKAKGRAAR